MNINDAEKPTEHPENIIKAIFEAQEKLAQKYAPIESKNGLLQTMDFPVDLNDRYGQARLKDFAWRFVEELAEAMESRYEDEEHFREELADALHFYVELMLLSGIKPKSIPDITSVPRQFFSVKEKSSMIWLVTETVGLAMNCLKNKPWKQTHMETDRVKYRGLLVQGFFMFIQFLYEAGFTNEMIFDYYFRKNQVNQFRQRSQY